MRFGGWRVAGSEFQGPSLGEGSLKWVRVVAAWPDDAWQNQEPVTSCGMAQSRLASFAIILIGWLGVESAQADEPRLERVSYASVATDQERDYFVYIPAGYSERKDWPVLLFLHGNGERGDGKGDLGFVLKHGPIYEAWIQKRDLPFVIIAPQMPLFGQGEVSYIKNRSADDIPRRLPDAVSPRSKGKSGGAAMQGQLAEPSPYPPEGMKEGWALLEDELMDMVDHVITNFRGDSDRVYLTGLSYGGYGTWHLGAQFPDRFAAIAPVVGHGHMDHAPSLAEAGLPIWQFAGGKDPVVPVRHFYEALNELERLGHPEVRFTIEADQGHAAWVRVYAGEDLYRWFLEHTLPR